METMTLKLFVLASLLAACTKDAPMTEPDAAPPMTCGSGADTENGGQLYACTTPDSKPGICTGDKFGVVMCFAACDARLNCETGSSSYVYQLADNSRVCFCIPNQAAPP